MDIGKDWSQQDGWPLHFINIRAQLKLATSNDLRKVLAFFGEDSWIEVQTLDETVSTISFSSNYGDVDATLSLYLQII